MHGTFIRLFLAGRKLGSNLWLPTSMLSSSITAFILSLPVALYLAIPLDPVCLSEALPFFVITIGFDKPLQVARAVFSHPQFSYPSVRPSPSPPLIKSAREVVLDAVEQVGESIVRDYAIEVFVLLVGASSRVTGLKEFCVLAALILTVDCIALFTFYVAVLTVLVEVHRIKALRASGATLAPPARLFQRISRSLFGEKGPVNMPSLAQSDDEYMEHGPENPAARLKLLLIVSFLTLHILNLCTTLTPDAALARHTTHPTHRTVDTVNADAARKVDITTSAWADVLARLSERAAHTHPEGGRMLLKVVPPVHVRILPPMSGAPRTFGAGFESFMSSWTSLVGDPILSKWIVFALALSVFLNGYLLKGLAAAAARTGQLRPHNVAVAMLEADCVRERTVVGKTCIETPRTQVPIARVPIVPIELPTPQPSPRPSSDALPQIPPTVSIRKVQVVDSPEVVRTFDECMLIFESGPDGVDLLNDEEVIILAQKGKIAMYALEKVLRDFDRAVKVRRALICV